MRISKKIKKIGLLSMVMVIPTLSGCVNMGSKFDCDVSSGGKCAPMHHVNKMADQGVFQNNYHYGNATLTRTKNNKGSGYPLNTFDGAPIRSGESVQQIWIGPYEDVTGNYHEPAYVYTVVNKGRWIGNPVNVIQD